MQEQYNKAYELYQAGKYNEALAIAMLYSS